MMKGLGCAWAALPYSTCGQRQMSLAATINFYNGALKSYGGISANGGPSASAELFVLAAGLITAILLLRN
jgi:hypothetical protein